MPDDIHDLPERSAAEGDGGRTRKEQTRGDNEALRLAARQARLRVEVAREAVADRRAAAEAARRRVLVAIESLRHTSERAHASLTRAYRRNERRRDDASM